MSEWYASKLHVCCRGLNFLTSLQTGMELWSILLASHWLVCWASATFFYIVRVCLHVGTCEIIVHGQNEHSGHDWLGTAIWLYHLAITIWCWWGTPVHMIRYTFYPWTNSLTGLSSCQLFHFPYESLGHMPNIVTVNGIWHLLSEPFLDLQVTINDCYAKGQSLPMLALGFFYH